MMLLFLIDIKPLHTQENQVKVMVHISVENYVKYLVHETEKGIIVKELDICMDRLCNSISLANFLLTRNITCVGTLNNNRIGIPAELKVR